MPTITQVFKKFSHILTEREFSLQYSQCSFLVLFWIFLLYLGPSTWRVHDEISYFSHAIYMLRPLQPFFTRPLYQPMLSIYHGYRYVNWRRKQERTVSSFGYHFVEPCRVYIPTHPNLMYAFCPCLAQYSTWDFIAIRVGLIEYDTVLFGWIWIFSLLPPSFYL